MLNPQIIPAIFAKDEEEYRRKLKLVPSLVTRVQVEIADGVFVPQVSMVVSAIENCPTEATIDAHLVVADPMSYVGECGRAGVDCIIFHAEACEEPMAVEQVMEEIRNMEWFVLLPVFCRDWIEQS